MSAQAQVISRSLQARSSAPRRRAAPILCLAACLLLLSRANAAAAFSSNRFAATKRRTTTIRHSASEQSPLGDGPWQEDDSYWDMLQAASKDPETFERFIEESMARKKLGKGGTKLGKARQTPIAKCKLTGVGGGETAPKKKGKYVPIEEWDAQRENGEGMSREERLQWEARRDGDRYRQDEILRHNLKSF